MSLTVISNRIDGWVWGTTDARVYAAVRIAFAIVCAVQWMELWSLKGELLSRSGMLAPPDAPFPMPFGWPTSDGELVVVMVVVAVAIVATGLGVATRLALALLFAWHMSLRGAAFPALAGYHSILRVISFTLLVSPIDRAWALWPIDRTAPSQDVPAYGLRLLQWQTVVLYMSTAWMKLDSAAWRSGTALYEAAQSEYARGWAMAWVVEPTFLVQGMTYFALAAELVLPFLLWNRRTRGYAFILGASLHLGIAIVMKLAVFAVSMIPLYLAFLERTDLDRVKLAFSALTSRFLLPLSLRRRRATRS